MPCGSLFGFWENETYSRAHDNCHMSTLQVGAWHKAIMDLAIKGNVMEITWNSKERNGLGKINNLRIRIESLLVKTRSLKIRTRSFRIKTRFSSADETTILNKCEKRISGEYSFMTRSFKGKDRSLPFCNGFSEILETHVHWKLYQDLILARQGSILVRQTALQVQSYDFS